MQCVVVYDGWQMECCGIPFALNDIVNWTVYEQAGPLFETIELGQVDYCYDSHVKGYEELSMLTGKVLEIKALYVNYVPSATQERLMVPESGILVDVETAHGWEKKIDEMMFAAYVVTLDKISIRPAKEADFNEYIGGNQ